MSNKTVLDTLIKKIRQGKVDLFVGAGFSFDAGAPRVKDIIGKIFEDADDDFKNQFDADTKDLKNVTEEFTKQYGRHELVSILKQLFDYKIKDTTAQQLLTRIPHFRNIYTTNYDCLLENAFGAAGVKHQVITTNSSMPYMDDDRISIYKLHGDITTMNDPDSIVISKTDYNQYFTSERYELIWEKLKQSFVSRYILFIGYSLSDDNINSIINRVKYLLKENMKGLFLVAPDLNESDQTRLRKNRISYINMKAHEVLSYILKQLNETIVKDYRTKKITQEIFNDFLLVNGGLSATTTSLPDCNQVNDIKAIDGHQQNEIMKLNIPNSIANDIKRLKFNNQRYIKGTHLTYPVYLLGKDDINWIKIYMNGILIEDGNNIDSLFVSPKVTEIDTVFKVPELNFYSKIKLYGYSKGDELHVSFECPIYIMELIFYKDDKSKLTVNVNFIDKIHDLSDYDLWINALRCISEGKMFVLADRHMRIKMNNTLEHDYDNFIQYFKTLKAIEQETDIIFPFYDQYSRKNYFNARAIYTYKTKKGAFQDSVPDGATMTFELDTRDKRNLPIEKFDQEAFIMFEPIQNYKFILGGKEFTIPCLTYFFNDCHEDSKQQRGQHTYLITMKNFSKSFQVYCSDKMPQQVGNEIKMAGYLPS